MAALKNKKSAKYARFLREKGNLRCRYTRVIASLNSDSFPFPTKATQTSIN